MTPGSNQVYAAIYPFSSSACLIIPAVFRPLRYHNGLNRHLLTSFQRLLQEVLFEGQPDLQFRPEYWSLYATKQQLVLAKSQSLAGLRDARPDSVKAIDRLVKNHGGNIDQLAFVPGLLKNGQFAAIVDSQSGAVVDTLKIDPWLD